MTTYAVARARHAATPRPSPKMQIVWQALEAAKDAGDDWVVAACRNLITLNRAGKWDAADWRMVSAFAEPI